MSSTSKFHNQIKDTQSKIQEIKLLNYPKTDGLGFLDLFLGNLEELLRYRPELIKMLKSQTETLHVEFNFLRSFLRKVMEQHNDHEELDNLRTRIIGLAYQSEYIIDLYLVNDAPNSSIMLALSKIIEQIKIIKSEVSKIYGEKKYHTQALNVAKTWSHVPSTDEVVGFKDEIEKILGYLVGDQKQLDVVSIVGMAGLGKTTLAKKMYEDPSITKRFHIRAWCTISQTYQRRELLLTILKDVIKVTDGISKLTDDELAAKLSQSLRGRKYLIVLDLWEIKAWNHLVRSFPDDNNQSRILITSRLQKVASQTKAGSNVHLLRDFSDDETWELFQKKLFEKESFSRGFLKVGEQIAQKCSRLPLAIVVIAGLLATVEKSVHKWEEIATNLSSHIFSDSKSQFKDILELSYNHLPGHLRSCYLYFAVFAEDQEIPVQKLKWLWIAEGFVRNTEAKSLEDVAEEYFMDLINSSLVITTKERSFGGVKACRLHDLLRDFCLEKVEEESFLQVLHVYNELKVLEVYDQRRLIIYSRAIDPLEAWPSGYSVRTLLHTSASKFAVYLDQDMDKTYYVSFIFDKFKLLRVMDIACINLYRYFGGIELMIHLRYLAIKIETKSIPSSIAKLWNLRTFLVKANRFYNSREVINVPDSLWDMGNLRNVNINHRAIFRVGRRRPENSSLLDNLETLSTPCFSRTGDAETFLRRLPKLQKLKCIFVDCWQLPELDFLNQLMSLKVSFKGSSSFSGSKGKLNFPQNLQKLTLSNFGLLWNDISIIGSKLPNLKVLKLIGTDNWDKTWNVDDGDFPKLKYLNLKELPSLHEWIASEDSFPNLEQLVLHNCEHLKEIPPCFGGITTLQMITVRGCQNSVKDSARSIQMEQQDEQGNEVKVTF